MLNFSEVDCRDPRALAERLQAARRAWQSRRPDRTATELAELQQRAAAAEAKVLAGDAPQVVSIGSFNAAALAALFARGT